jgi:hypothetical protein
MALLAGVIVALVAASTAFYAVRSHLASRPVDLRDATASLASTLEEVLLASQLAPAAITRSEEKAYADATAFWTHAEFTVRVPQQLNPAGIAEIVRNEMTSQHVAASDIADGGAQPALRLSLTNRPFATIHFQQAAPSQAAPEPNADPCYTVLETLREVVEANGLYTSASAGVHTVTAPPDQTHWEIAARLSSALSSAGVTVVWNSDESAIRLGLARDGKTCTELVVVASAPAQLENAVPPQESLPLESAPSAEEDATAPEAEAGPSDETTPKVAIIVDDGGYGGDVTEAFLALDPRLTLAILPNTPHCRDTGERAAAAGFEVMLHMPMESIDGEESAFTGQLESGMTAETIEAATRSALQLVPGAKGVNNHTGSRFTQDAAAMEAFLRPVKELGLYFVDSRTTPDSVGLQTARAMDIPSARRHVFLDNDGNGEFIRQQFAELVALAQQQGRAIGICHFRTSTAATLAELLPTLEEAGIELVHASEIVQ